MNYHPNQKISKKQLKVLVVIHGYPPYYMAGSEVYTFNKCRELARHNKVFVFTRIEDEFQRPYNVKETIENDISIIRVNKPGRDYTFRSKYEDLKLAQIFESFLIKIRPNVVHIDHLSHLTILIIDVIKKYNIPIVFTLHDYWMICIRGQLIKDDFSICTGPNINKCAQCNQKYFVSKVQAKKEIELWQTNLLAVNKKIDLFIAPSKFLREKYIEYGIPEDKIIYMDYGFDTSLFNDIKKHKSEKIRFGYTGRIIPVKGILLLIEAFNKLNHTKAVLNIYGKLPNSSIYLKEKCQNSNIRFKGEYNNRDISKILSEIDVLVIPSIWYENSPLVIHEAFLAKIPVITSNMGGMAELIQHERNGLLFESGSIDDLREKMERFLQEPDLIKKLTKNNNSVRSIQEDIRDLEKYYYKFLIKKEVLDIVAH